jgi:hypothetical protein
MKGPIKKSSRPQQLSSGANAAQRKNKNAITVMQQKRKAAKIMKEAGHAAAISAASGEFFSGKSERTKKKRSDAKKLFAAARALKKGSRKP